MDSDLGKLYALPKDQENIFLIQEFEHILSEIDFPVKYIMELFVSNIMCDDNVIKKINYRKSKDILVMYRGLLFLLEKKDLKLS